MKRYLIYGAVARPPDRPSWFVRLRGRATDTLKAARDIDSVRRGNVDVLDYRNYLHPGAANVGDIAISRSVAKMIQIADPNAAIAFANWGEFDRLDIAGASHSTVVVAGSGYLPIGKDGRLSDRLTTDAECFNRWQSKVILLGIGVNRPQADTPTQPTADIDEVNRSAVANILARATHCSVRDEFSVEFLRRMTERHVELLGDPALHLAALTGITRGQRVNRPAPVVGVNFSFHGPSSTELLRRNFFEYVSALKQLSELTGCQFRYFVHFDTEALIPKLLRTCGISIEVVAGDPEYLCSEYAKLDLHICGMLHSCILASSVDTPCVALAYDIKHRGFLNLFGLGEYCLPAANIKASEIVAAAQSALHQQTQIRSQLSIKRIELEQKTKQFVAQSLTDG